MEQLLLSLADASPVAVVAIFALWRMSLVMIKLADSLVEIATANSENVGELIESKTIKPS